MEKLKTLVVDDSAVYRKIMSAAVEGTGMAAVEHTASNGKLALERLQHGKYDVVLLDVNMPEMDGIEALKIIKQKWADIPVIMISSKGGNNVETTIRALELGAMDFILKPLEENYEKNMEIMKGYLKVLFTQIKMEAFTKEIHNPVNNIELLKKTNTQYQVNKSVKTRTSISGFDLIVVASSTGGPVALETLFQGIRQDFHKPILVVQHMPKDFTRVLSETLDKKYSMKFIEGSEGDIIRAGQCIIAPGGKHMLVEQGERSIRKIKLSDSDYVNGVRPAADVTFKSVAEVYRGARILAVVLTGMGSDGREGVRELKQKCSCYCITQSEQTCVVYGMPRSVKEAGLSDEVADIDQIAKRIQHIAEYGVDER